MASLQHIQLWLLMAMLPADHVEPRKGSACQPSLATDDPCSSMAARSVATNIVIKFPAQIIGGQKSRQRIASQVLYLHPAGWPGAHCC